MIPMSPALFAAILTFDSVPGPGVSVELARERRTSIRDVSYRLSLDVAEAPTTPVRGHATIRFTMSRPGRVVLDFRAPVANVGATTANGRPVSPRLSEDHITIPATAIQPGPNEITVSFIATDQALNRRDGYFYALFVPDRASTAFPCFDQPDLKARFQLALTIPSQWRAVANGSIESSAEAGPRTTVRFRATAPISTYLFSFAAGDLRSETAERDGRRFTMYHRETDTAKVARNLAAIFDLHAGALRWLEDYTGIRYPFEKFDFFAIPAFQFGGMEHPGAVWYSAAGLFLDQAATRSQHLSRANVIAHETAHMWFGDLVTMQWFNDVWMKEVFANFMAAKIVGPSFPDIDHDLRFFLGHHPSAYGVDRTAGANPIRQPLENLREAGSLYGAIIYQKAPIAMRQLERTIGETAFRDGLREYLAGHQFGNATWTDLIRILDRRTPDDLRRWSRVWIESAGRPIITAEYDRAAKRLLVRQKDPTGRGRLWPQQLSLTLGLADSMARADIHLRGPTASIALPVKPTFILLGTDGVGYGRFVADSATRGFLLERLPSVPIPVVRGTGWQTLYEEVLDGRLRASTLLDAALAALVAEQDDLISQQLLGTIGGVFWRYLDEPERRKRAPAIEAAIWQRLADAKTPSRKVAYFNALVGVALSDSGLARLERVWRDQAPPPGLTLEEPQYTALAEALAMRGVSRTEEILSAQEARISNPDRLARFRFVRPALSSAPAVRDSVFASFAKPENRRRESWVLDAMGYLNHPLRQRHALRYVAPALELVEEIKRTGDIFFPTGWLLATLDGHQSPDAAHAVAAFLRSHPKLPPRLRAKVLQTADGLERAARNH